MAKLIRVSNKKIIKGVLPGEPSVPGYIQITSNMLKRTANLSDLTDVEEARKNLGVVAASNIGSGAIPDSVVQRDSTGRFKILDAEATNEPVSLNQLNSKQYALTSNNITGTLPISKGGTGATNAAAAYSALGGKALGKLDSIAITDAKITGTLPLTKGGTGATTAAAARTNLGLGTLATQSSIALTSSALTGTLPLSKGGTGATTAAAARTNLGLGALATEDNFNENNFELQYGYAPMPTIRQENIYSLGDFGRIHNNHTTSYGRIVVPQGGTSAVIIYEHNHIINGIITDSSRLINFREASVYAGGSNIYSFVPQIAMDGVFWRILI